MWLWLWEEVNLKAVRGKAECGEGGGVGLDVSDKVLDGM